MTLFLVTVAIVFGFVGGSFSKYLGFRKKIQKTRDEKYADLKKIFDLTNNRSKIVTKEFNAVVEFVNQDLPAEITNIVLAEPKLTILKEKGGIPDKAYLEALEPVILGVQNVVAQRVILAVNNITAETIKDIKELMNNDVS